MGTYMHKANAKARQTDRQIWLIGKWWYGTAAIHLPWGLQVANVAVGKIQLACQAAALAAPESLPAPDEGALPLGSCGVLSAVSVPDLSHAQLSQLTALLATWPLGRDFTLIVTSVQLPNPLVLHEVTYSYTH